MKIKDVLYSLYNGTPVNTSEAVKMVTEGPIEPKVLRKEAEEDGWSPVFITHNGIDFTLHYTTPWQLRTMYLNRNHRVIGLREGVPMFLVAKR